MNKLARKLILITIIVIFITGCAHQKQIKIVEENTVFYYQKKPNSYYRQNLETVIKPAFTSIAAVGDIMIGEHVAEFIEKHGIDYPFDSTRFLLQNAQFTIGNLEAPFSKTGTSHDKKFTFKVDPEYAPGLVNAGFDVVNLANNHMMDFGEEALINNLKTLDSLNLQYCGAGLNYEQAKKPAILDYNGTKVAFLGYSMTFPKEFWATADSAGTCYPYEEDMIESIRQCEQLADFTVASFHWGQELRNTPKDYQIYFAHKAIDAGADLILGHHPHILQGMEVYKNRLIIYSLGNFAFGSYSYKAKDSIILKTYLNHRGLLYARVIPISVYNAEVNFQPQILKKTKADSVLSYLNDISLQLNNNKSIVTGHGIIWGEWLFETDSLITDSLRISQKVF